MENGPEEHGGVPVRQDKPIAVWPDRILWIEVHDPIPERVDERRQSHRRAGMTRLGLLDGVDGKRPDGMMVSWAIAGSDFCFSKWKWPFLFSFSLVCLSRRDAAENLSFPSGPDGSPAGNRWGRRSLGILTSRELTLSQRAGAARLC